MGFTSFTSVIKLEQSRRLLIDPHALVGSNLLIIKAVSIHAWNRDKFCCLTPLFQGSEELPQRVLAHTSVCFT